MERTVGIIRSKHSKEELYSLMYWKERQGALVGRIRGVLSHSFDSFFQEVSASLRFPDPSGWNWGAFDDWMTDLDWFVFSEIVIVIDDYSEVFTSEVFTEENQASEQVLILERHLHSIVQYWKNEGVPIMVLLNN